MKTIADVLREEGIEQGIERGARKGIAETLLTLLSHKIGQIPEDTQTQIRQLDEQPLQSIVTSYDQINSLDDLNNYL